MPRGHVATLSTLSLYVCGRCWSGGATEVLTQNIDKCKIIYCGRWGRKVKEKQGGKKVNDPYNLLYCSKWIVSAEGCEHQYGHFLVLLWSQISKWNPDMSEEREYDGGNKHSG